MIFSEKPVFTHRVDARRNAFADHALRLADSGFDESEAMSVDRRHRVVVGLIAGELEHFLFVAHRGAARAHLIAGASVVFELRVSTDRLQNGRDRSAPW